MLLKLQLILHFFHLQDDHYYSFSKFPARVANGEDDINENENGSYHNYGSHDDGNEE